MTGTTKAKREKQRSGVLRPNLFQPYVRHLAGLLKTVKDDDAEKKAQLMAALDGQPGRELRKLYTLNTLRSTGTYFTGSDLANRLVSSSKEIIPNVTQVIDPACGAGDLLVACARHLPLKSDLTKTLVDWGKRLAGFDIISTFVEATHYRLALLALERGGRGLGKLPREVPLAALFPQIQLRSGMDAWSLPAKPTLIVVNPPFSYGIASKNCTWASGRVSQAASFMDNCLKNASVGTRLLAILPDVLRTGTRYERWRSMIAETARVRTVEIVGQFDDETEISVFLLDLEVCKPSPDQQVNWAQPSQGGGSTIKDVFNVHVGSVVPFRLDGTGAWFPYARSEDLPPWETVRRLGQHTRFNGTTYKPPFVAIRRTSKSDYHVRCIGTLVTGRKLIAVENHLLLAMPRDKKVSTCKKLLELLRRPSTSDWMNERIRCRHLTVGAIGDLPWREGE